MRGSSIPASRSGVEPSSAPRDPNRAVALDTPEGFRAMRRMQSGRRDVASRLPLAAAEQLRGQELVEAVRADDEADLVDLARRSPSSPRAPSGAAAPGCSAMTRAVLASERVAAASSRRRMTLAAASFSASITRLSRVFISPGRTTSFTPTRSTRTPKRAALAHASAPRGSASSRRAPRAARRA